MALEFSALGAGIVKGTPLGVFVSSDQIVHVVGGTITQVGDIEVAGIAYYDGTNWREYPSNVSCAAVDMAWLDQSNKDRMIVKETTGLFAVIDMIAKTKSYLPDPGIAIDGSAVYAHALDINHIVVCYMAAGSYLHDTTYGWRAKYYNGSSWTTLPIPYDQYFNTTTEVNNYTFVAGDLGKILRIADNSYYYIVNGAGQGAATSTMTSSGTNTALNNFKIGYDKYGKIFISAYAWLSSNKVLITRSFNGTTWNIVSGLTELGSTVFSMLKDFMSGELYLGAGSYYRRTISTGVEAVSLGATDVKQLTGVCKLASGEYIYLSSLPLFDACYGNRIARWDGSYWHKMGTGKVGGTGVASSVNVTGVAYNGSGDVYMIGTFTTIGGTRANKIAKWVKSAEL